MPRGMDERFEDPSENAEENDSEITSKDTSESTDNREATEDHSNQATQEPPESQADTKSAGTRRSKSADEPLNIREDWDSATIYVEPEQSEDIEVTFTRLKKQLKRDGYILEKNKHFYRAVFEIAFDEHREETKERIRELAVQDADTDSMNQ